MRAALALVAAAIAVVSIVISVVFLSLSIVQTRAAERRAAKAMR